MRDSFNCCHSYCEQKYLGSQIWEWMNFRFLTWACSTTNSDGWEVCCSPSTVTSLEILHSSLFPPYHSSSHIPLISPQFARRTHPVFLFINYVYISHRHISSVSADWVKLAALCSLWITAYFWLTFLVTKIRKTSTTQHKLFWGKLLENLPCPIMWLPFSFPWNIWSNQSSFHCLPEY